MKNNKILNKGIFLFALMTVMALMTVGTGLAADPQTGNITLVAPTTGATIDSITESIIINVNTTGIPSGFYANITSCNVIALSTLNPTTATIIATFTNATVSNTGNFTVGHVWGNATFDASGLVEDNTDYVLFVNCTDGTTSFNSTATTTGITIDYTTPKLPATYGTTGTNYTYETALTSTSGLNFSVYTFANRSTVEGGCKLVFVGNNPGTSSYTAIYNEPLCYYDFDSSNKIVSEGDYIWYMTASDGTTTGYSETHKLVINTPGGSINPALIPGLIPDLGIPTPLLVGILFLVYMIAKGKK